MELKSEEYPYCQLNETVNLGPDGKVLSRSLMINLRNQSPQVVYKNYLELKRLIDNGKNSPEKKEKKSEVPLCPKCKSPMIVRNNGKTGEPFWSCPQWPICNGTRPMRKRIGVPTNEVPVIEE